jgi:ABC-type protease/lipase transport system fused ATPase/permease subunit
VLKEGRVAAFGERDGMLRALMQQSQQQRVVAMQGQDRRMLPTSVEGGAGR